MEIFNGSNGGETVQNPLTLEPMLLRKLHIQTIDESQKNSRCLICAPQLAMSLRESERKIRSDFERTPAAVLAVVAERMKGRKYCQQADVRDVLWHINQYFGCFSHLSLHFGVHASSGTPTLFNRDEFLYYLYKNSPDRENQVAPSSTFCPALRHRVERHYRVGWNEACRLEGWTPYSEFHSWDVERIKMRIRAHSKDSVTAPLINNPELQSLACAVRDIFGSWAKGIEIMGFKPNPSTRLRSVNISHRARFRTFMKRSNFQSPFSVKISISRMV